MCTFPGSHSLAFSCDGSQLLTASVDNTARDPRPKIQQVVKKILWPSSLVMQLMLLLPPVIAQSRPPPPLRGGDASVNSVHLFPKNTYHIVVCNKTSSVCIMTLQGQGA